MDYGILLLYRNAGVRDTRNDTSAGRWSWRRPVPNILNDRRRRIGRRKIANAVVYILAITSPIVCGSELIDKNTIVLVRKIICRRLQFDCGVTCQIAVFGADIWLNERQKARRSADQRRDDRNRHHMNLRRPSGKASNIVVGVATDCGTRYQNDNAYTYDKKRDRLAVHGQLAMDWLLKY